MNLKYAQYPRSRHIPYVACSHHGSKQNYPNLGGLKLQNGDPPEYAGSYYQQQGYDEKLQELVQKYSQ